VSSSAPSARGAHRLVVDPLGHCGAESLFPRNTLYGRAALGLLLALDVFGNGSWVGPTPERVDAITFYVMGSEESGAPGSYWTTLPAWPAATRTPLYLGGGRALLPAPPPVGASASFIYAPDASMPTYGGSNFYLTCGPLNQAGIEEGGVYARRDVLSFTSARAGGAVAIVGALSVDLWVASTAVDTDFTAKLTDVYPNGSSLLLQDGIVRMRWRGGAAGGSAPALMVPGAVYPASIDLWSTAFILAPGHALRLSISSSNYPRFSPNANTGAPLITPWAPVNATNSIFWGGATPSALWLPVVDVAALPPFPILDAVEAAAVRLGLLAHAPDATIDERRARVAALDELARAPRLHD
jgi:putative CocE/NonD family hydrolase